MVTTGPSAEQVPLRRDTVPPDLTQPGSGASQSNPERPPGSVEESGRRRQPLMMASAVLVCIAMYAAAMALAISADARTDRQRTLFDDVSTLAALEDAHVKEHGGNGVPLNVASGEEVTVGGHRFVPSPGNTVDVVVNRLGYCIRVHNRDSGSLPVTYDSGDSDPTLDEPGGACR